jgi:hypothetical protein
MQVIKSRRVPKIEIMEAEENYRKAENIRIE